MSHIAFDLGLRTSGIAWPGGSDFHTSPNHLHKSPITPAIEHARYSWWRDTFRMVLVGWPGATVVVEAPILHPKHPSGSIGLVVLHGILRGVAIDGGHEVCTVTPSELKRYATGKGNADKDAMVAAARRLGWEGDDHNEADAFLAWSWFACQAEVAA